MTYDLAHSTIYQYNAPVTVSHHAARLEPRRLPAQQPEGFTLGIEPEPTVCTMRTDYFGNRTCFFSIEEIHQHLAVRAISRVTVTATTPIDPTLSPPWEKVVELFSDPVSREVVEPYQFVFESPLLRPSLELADYARQSFADGTPLLNGVLDLNRRIYRDFKYDPVATTISTPLEEVIEKRRGVCQDFAHLAIACLRSLGLPARYVSGYLRTHPLANTDPLVGADASHAWFSAYCPNTGWVEFDPTNNLMPATDHITIGYGRDYSDVSPVTGIVFGGGKHDLKVSVHVTPLAPGT
jgi:transglutaminase-like putative cysteine protease